MSKLKTFLDTLSSDEKLAFAAACKTTWPHLRNVMYGYRPAGEKLSVAIEQNSNCKVTRIDLHPDDYWEIWPELRLAASTGGAHV